MSGCVDVNQLFLLRILDSEGYMALEFHLNSIPWKFVASPPIHIIVMLVLDGTV